MWPFAQRDLRFKTEAVRACIGERMKSGTFSYCFEAPGVYDLRCSIYGNLSQHDGPRDRGVRLVRLLATPGLGGYLPIMVVPGNNLNTAKGREFQLLAARVLGTKHGVVFNLDHPLAIGNPPKNHRFDLVSTDGSIVAECKSYSWTVSGNAPSAKLGFLNEALLYLSHLPSETLKFVVLRTDRHERRIETVGEYYYRMNRHLLRNVRILEIEVDTGIVRELSL